MSGGEVRAWELLSELKPSGRSKLVTDIDAINIIAKHLEDGNFMSKIGKKRYDDILKNYAGKCTTCDVPKSIAAKELPPHHEMLATLEEFVNKHGSKGGKPGFHKVLEELGKKDIRKQFGAEFVTRILKESDDVAEFEFKFVSGKNNTADWITLAEIPIDGKSWSVVKSINKIPTFRLSEQLKTYFKKGEFEIWFDYARFKNSTNKLYKNMTPDEALIHIKKKYQKLFEKTENSQELFDFITEGGNDVAAFENIFGVTSVSEFKNQIVSDINNVALYGAFKVK